MKRPQGGLTTGGGGEDEGAPGRSWTWRPGGVEGKTGRRPEAEGREGAREK